MRPDDVTLVIPCHNAETTLPRVLWHADRLDPPPRTVICVVGDGDDATRGIAERHACSRALIEREPRGLPAALNVAMAETSTPWLAKVDADILLEPDWLGSLCATASDRGVDHLGGRAREQVDTLGDRWRARHNTIDYFGDEPIANHWRMNGSNTLSRVDALRDVGGWDEQFRVAFEDIDLNRRLLRAGYDLYYDPAARAQHVRTDTWREALQTAWHYHGGPGRSPPAGFSDVVSRFPRHASEALYQFAIDVKRNEPELACMSLLGAIYDLTLDLGHARGNSP